MLFVVRCLLLTVRARDVLNGDNGITTQCINCLNVKALKVPSWEGKVIGKQVSHDAYAVFMDEYDEQTLKKMKVLAISILEFDSSRDLVAVVREYGVSAATKSYLKQQGWILFYVQSQQTEENNLCVSFDSKRVKARVPQGFYHDLIDDSITNTIALTNYRVVAFITTNFLMISSPESWFNMNDVILSTADGQLVTVNYWLLHESNPLTTKKSCPVPPYSIFQQLIDATVANACVLTGRVHTSDMKYNAVYWKEPQQSLWSSR